jgi:hypothetical protein
MHNFIDVLVNPDNHERISEWVSTNNIGDAVHVTEKACVVQVHVQDYHQDILFAQATSDRLVVFMPPYQSAFEAFLIRLDRKRKIDLI